MVPARPGSPPGPRLAWARLWGGRTTFDEATGIYVSAGLRGGYARGGTTVGGVFLTGNPRPGPALLRHEAVHADQWARHGLGFAARYLLEERAASGHREPVRDQGRAAQRPLPREPPESDSVVRGGVH